jgi:uncharacterized protein YndB with AHSA1/START domain
MKKISKQLEINVPVGIVFDLFNSFTHFPRWMKGVKKVEQVRPGRARWFAEAPDGTLAEWETEIIAVEYGKRIAWRAVANSILETEGQASFAETNSGTTIMHLALGYDAPSTQVDKGSAAAFNDNLEQRLEEDLIWFRLLVERAAQTNGRVSQIRGVPSAPLAGNKKQSAPVKSAHKNSVYFDTFSSIRRAGQVIQPARLITSLLDKMPARQSGTRSPIIVKLDQVAARLTNKTIALNKQPRSLAPVPIYRPIIASVIVVGLLLISGAGWIGASKWPTIPVSQHSEPAVTEVSEPPTIDANIPAAAAGIKPTATFEQKEALPAAATAAATATAAAPLVRTSKGKPVTKSSGKRAQSKGNGTRWVTAWLNPIVKPFVRRKSSRRR